jgi:hypothetical protein
MVEGMALVVTALALAFHSAAPACARNAARTAITQTKPRLALIGDKVLITPDQADLVLCFDVSGDRRDDMLVSLASGGTAGDVGWLLFLPNGSRWRLAGSGSGYKLGLLRAGSAFQVVQPVYRDKDPNCCPTGGFDRTLYRWDGTRLVVARTWHTRSLR